LQTALVVQLVAPFPGSVIEPASRPYGQLQGDRRPQRSGDLPVAPWPRIPRDQSQETLVKLDTYKTFLDQVKAHPSAPASGMIEGRVLLPTYGWLQGGITLNQGGFLAIAPASSTGFDDGSEILVDLEDVIAIQAI
jgi:hypothetical protein